MTEIVCVRSVWDHTGLPAPRFPGVRLHELHYGPEPGWPFGRRGLALATAWQQLEQGAAGMLVIDADVAFDPCDMKAMLEAVKLEPGAVHLAPIRLWPASTMRSSWVWGHHSGMPGQLLEVLEDPTAWTFSFTYLPRRLIEACDRAGWSRWTFPAVDTRVAGVAAAVDIPVRVVPDCWPKHCHF